LATYNTAFRKCRLDKLTFPRCTGRLSLLDGFPRVEDAACLSRKCPRYPFTKGSNSGRFEQFDAGNGDDADIVLLAKVLSSIEIGGVTGCPKLIPQAGKPKCFVDIPF
jgi:hypothetical protein